MNENDFFSLLNLVVDDLTHIDKVVSEGSNKSVYISRDPIPTYCPVCGMRMHSKGIYTRKVNHQILQDTTHLSLYVNQRRWICPNCSETLNESFPFLNRYSHCTNILPLLILEAMRDLNASTAAIAKRFNLSDTQVHNIFTAYVDLKRLPLPEILCVDEVYINISEKEKYALVLMDFETGEIIDILHNRWKNTAEKYFRSIPYQERKNVKFIISDGYQAYIDFPKEYFPNALSIIDSFHVTKFLINLLNIYLNKLMKKYQEIDNSKLLEKNYKTNSNNKTIKDCTEVILLRTYRWLLLKNYDDINYSYRRHYQKGLKMYLDTYELEKMFFSLAPNLLIFRNLKEKYITFSHTIFDDYKKVSIELDKLINEYEASDFRIFKDFASFLKKYHDEIIRSFTVRKVARKTINEQDELYSRLSNGPMESFNRKPKDYKRNSRGFSNFDYTRNRILWATRKKTPILAHPKSSAQIHSYEGKKRGPYKKKNK